MTVVSVHQCGVAIAYREKQKTKKKLLPSPGREQGSLISYQKRQIADAVSFLSLNHTYGAKIFVATTSNHWDTTDERLNISRFCHNLRNGYGVNQYVWVREYNKKGSPHFHFVADFDFIEAQAISRYWSGLFGESAKNCVRFGSRPLCEKCGTPTHWYQGANHCPKCNCIRRGKRMYEIKSLKHAFYLSAYMGKDRGKARHNNNTGRSFSITQQLGDYSKPVTYHVNYSFRHERKTVLTAKGFEEIEIAYPTGTVLKDPYNPDNHFNKTDYQWKKAKDHQVWFGRLKSGTSNHLKSQTNWKQKQVTPNASPTLIAEPLNTFDSQARLSSLLL